MPQLLLCYSKEAGQRTTLFVPTFQPTEQPTESDRKRPRYPTEKVVLAKGRLWNFWSYDDQGTPPPPPRPPLLLFPPSYISLFPFLPFRQKRKKTLLFQDI